MNLKSIDLSLTKEREKAEQEIATLLIDVDQITMSIDKIHALVQGYKKTQKAEQVEIAELRKRLTETADAITDGHSKLNDVLKIVTFMEKLADRYKKGKISIETYREVYRRVSAEFSSKKDIKDLLGDACDKLHGLIKSEITIEGKLKGKVQESVTALTSITQRMNELVK